MPNLSFLFGCAKKVKIENIKSFSFHYTYGAMKNACVVYTLTNEDKRYTATVKPKGAPKENTLEFEVDGEFAKELEKLLSKNKVGRWNGFKKSNKRVADGKSFSLYITMADGRKVNARGYMKWPRNYAEVKAGIIELFSGLQ